MFHSIIIRISIVILPLFCISSHLVFGNIVVEEEIEWYENSNSKVDGLTSKTFIAFENVRYDEQKDYLGIYSKQISLKQEKIIGLNIIDVQYETIDKNAIEDISGFDFIKGDIELSYINTTCQKINYGEILFTPIIYNAQTASYQRVTKYTIEVLTQKSKSHTPINKAFTTSSVLETGEWYKIAVLQEGIFKISYSFLKDMGIDIDNLNPNNFRLYGNGGKMLPELNSAPRADDIQQNAVYIEGALDGSFDEYDYVLFYGQSSHNWKYNSSANLFEHEMNKYSDTTFYFITFSNTGEPAKRIGTQASLPAPTQTVTTFNDYAYYEKDEKNLIKSGSQWFGESFDIKTNFDFIFDFPNIDVASPATIKFSGAGRSDVANSFTVSAEGNSTNVPINSVNTTSYTSRYANVGSGLLSMTPSGSTIKVNVSYSKPNSSSIGWLDKIEVNTRRNLAMLGGKLFFRDVQSVGTGNVSNFRLSGVNSSTKVWEITDPLNIKEQQYNLAGSTLSFAVSTDSLRSFAAFSSNHLTPIPLGSVENQNLHGITQADMIIISHPDFLNQADQLANFHTDEGLSVITVTPQQIYNEFSSGSQDIVAIRDFVRMLYERNPATSIPKYLLLFGDGSYDNKNRLIGNTNFIPSYQTPNSVDVIGSLVSDDYYGLLDPDEGTWVGTEYVDLAIGRLCTKNTTEADNVVRKILNYNVSSSMKNWRNKIVFIADDEDGNIHMSQSNSLAAILEANEKSYNPDKIFIDAYKQESTSGGSRYPEVNEALTESVEKGSLIINYTGHGGEVGWAVERILNVPQINAWDNTSNFPLFVTATCEFSRWDDPARTSAGELVLLNASGGIGLLTTVRVVYSSPNFALNKSVFNVGFTKINNKMPTMGEVFMQVKNLHASSPNNRNFTLLGDPALRLAYPKYNIKTTKLNGVALTSNDTINALSKVTIDGEIQDENGDKLSSFNGVITPLFLDKRKL